MPICRPHPLRRPFTICKPGTPIAIVAIFKVTILVYMIFMVTVVVVSIGESKIAVCFS